MNHHEKTDLQTFLTRYSSFRKVESELTAAELPGTGSNIYYQQTSKIGKVSYEGVASLTDQGWEIQKTLDK